MFDNNDYINSLFGDLSSTTTTTESTEQSTYSPQTDYQTTSSYEKDDYSTTQNYTEEQSYDSTSVNAFRDSQETRVSNFREAPLIQKSEQSVSLIKSQSKIRLETRMKIVLSVFSVVVVCLLFITAFNFIKANKLEAGFADKQAEINMLNASISTLNNEYIRVTSEEFLKNWAEEENGFVEKNEQNTLVYQLDELYEEPVIEEIPSNWFNDVCEFFSRLFA